MSVEAPKAGARPPMEKPGKPAEIVVETPVMSEAGKRLLTYATLGAIFTEIRSQAKEPLKPNVPFFRKFFAKRENGR